MTSIRNEIVEIVKQASKPRVPDLSDDSIPLLRLGLDSLDYATAIMEIEEKYKIEIGEQEMERLRSLKDIVEFIEARAEGMTRAVLENSGDVS
jgi:acyl carrier protein